MSSEKKARRLQVLRLGMPGSSHRLRNFLDRAVRVFVLLAVLAALVEVGLVAQALWLASQRVTPEPSWFSPATSPPRPPPSVAPVAKGAVRGREPTTEDRESFSEASYLEDSPGPPTLDHVTQRVRAFYRSRGVRDETYVMMCALDEADRGYQDALLEAQSSLRAGDAAAAVQRLQAALAEQDPRHSIARLRLLEALEVFAREARNPALAQKSHEELMTLRERVLQTTFRALAEAGGQAAIKPDELAAQLKRNTGARRELIDRLCRDGTLRDGLSTLFEYEAKQ